MQKLFATCSQESVCGKAHLHTNREHFKNVCNVIATNVCGMFTVCSLHISSNYSQEGHFVHKGGFPISKYLTPDLSRYSSSSCSARFSQSVGNFLVLKFHPSIQNCQTAWLYLGFSDAPIL